MARIEPARGSWFAAVLGLSVLAVVAFIVGAVAGLVWKEPGLLLAYLRGDTAEVAWTVASSEETPPAAPAPAPEPAAEAEPARGAVSAPSAEEAPVPEAAPAPDPKPAPSAVAAAPPGQIAVQVGAFSERAAAERLRVRLRDAGFQAYLATDSRNDRHWRVRVGPFASRSEAERVAGRLERNQDLPTWILDEAAE